MHNNLSLCFDGDIHVTMITQATYWSWCFVNYGQSVREYALASGQTWSGEMQEDTFLDTIRFLLNYYKL